jgi:predicted RNA binding protein YcfA (HicA-like mRNA interferase family)
MAKRGCTFKLVKDKGGHIGVVRGGWRTVTLLHGGRKQLTKGVMAGVMKQRGLDDA